MKSCQCCSTGSYLVNTTIKFIYTSINIINILSDVFNFLISSMQLATIYCICRISRYFSVSNAADFSIFIDFNITYNNFIIYLDPINIL